MTSTPRLAATVLALALPAAAQTDHALSYDGIDDGVFVPHDPGLATEVFTFAAWIRVDPDAAPITQVIASRGEDDVTDVLPWAFYVRGDGLLAVQIESPSGAGSDYPSTLFVADGEWHHVAVSRDAEALLRFVVDGTVFEVADTREPGPAVQRFTIGVDLADGLPAYVHPPNDWFHGEIDDAGLWSRALSGAELGALASDGIFPCEGIAGAWTFDGDGQVVRDVSGNGRDGTLGETQLVEADDPAHVASTAPAGAGPIADLGQSLPWSAGDAALSVRSLLCADAPLTLGIADAAPGTPLSLVVGASILGASFKGGTLVPTPTLVLPLGTTPPDGAWSLAASWPSSVPVGSAFVLQAWFPAPGTMAGFAASNALELVTP